MASSSVAARTVPNQLQRLVQRQAAQELALINMEAGWETLQTPEYLQQSSGFRRATRDLRKAADEQNLDKATVAYLEVSLRGVQCHRQIRP